MYLAHGRHLFNYFERAFAEDARPLLKPPQGRQGRFDGALTIGVGTATPCKGEKLYGRSELERPGRDLRHGE